MRRKFVYNIPRKHLPLLRFSDRNKKVAKFQSVKNETSSKRLSLYVVFPPRAQKPPAWEFLQIYGNLCEMQKEVCDFATFLFLRMPFQLVYDLCFKVVQDVAYACVSPMWRLGGKWQCRWNSTCLLHGHCRFRRTDLCRCGECALGILFWRNKIGVTLRRSA